MKITVTRMKEIIREEYSRMNEADGPRVVDLKLTPDQLESQLESGSGDVPRGEFGEAFAKLLGLELADISEVYLIDSPKFQGLVVTQGGEQIRLRLGSQGADRSSPLPDNEDAAVQRARELKKVRNQFLAMADDPDVYESIEESRETLKQFGKMAKGPERETTARQATEKGLGDKLDRETDAAAVRTDLNMKEEAGDAAADPATDELRTKAMEVFRNLSGVQQNERDMVELLLNLIELAKSENINQQELRRRLRLAKDAAAQIAT